MTDDEPIATPESTQAKVAGGLQIALGVVLLLLSTLAAYL